MLACSFLACLNWSASVEAASWQLPCPAGLVNLRGGTWVRCARWHAARAGPQDMAGKPPPGYAQMHLELLVMEMCQPISAELCAQRYGPQHVLSILYKQQILNCNLGICTHIL